MRVGVVLVSLMVVVIGMSGCMPRIPVVNRDGKDGVYKDLQGNEIKTSNDGKTVDVNVKGENGNDMSIQASQDKPFSTCGLPDPPRVKVSDKTSVTEMEIAGKKVVQAMAFSDASVSELGDFYEGKFTKMESKSMSNDGGTMIGEVDGMKVVLTFSKQPDGSMVFVQTQK